MSTAEAAPLVLVVDDEENIRFLVQSGLELGGFRTTTATNGSEALDAVERERPALIVLDVMMPGMDGFAVLERLQATGVRIPVIMLTARDTTDDRVRGLTDGAADYLVKPFAIAELVARVRLRIDGGAAGPDADVLRCADLEIDRAAHRVTRAGVIVELSRTEFNLLEVLLSNQGRVLTRAQLLERVWHYDFDGDSSVLDTYISYLRRKIDQTEPKLIHTVRGVGFSLRADP
ncbi:MAG: response regulator transcription factor [Actinomycetia bacterium]|nr:response regulator transcription factor [Actinomycetes bacterium]